jgi:hypothetical protein
MPRRKAERDRADFENNRNERRKHGGHRTAVAEGGGEASPGR